MIMCSLKVRFKLAMWNTNVQSKAKSNCPKGETCRRTTMSNAIRSLSLAILIAVISLFTIPAAMADSQKWLQEDGTFRPTVGEYIGGSPVQYEQAELSDCAVLEGFAQFMQDDGHSRSEYEPGFWLMLASMRHGWPSIGSATTAVRCVHILRQWNDANKREK